MASSIYLRGTIWRFFAFVQEKTSIVAPHVSKLHGMCANPT
jgi:hypothetical protein